MFKKVNVAVSRLVNHKGLSFSVSDTKEMDRPVKHKMIMKPKKKKDKRYGSNHKNKS